MTPPPPRICFLLDHIGAGGVQTLVITLCRRLLAEGCKVDLIRLKDRNRMLDRVPDGVRTMTVREMWQHSREAECSGTVRFFISSGIRLKDRGRRLKRFILRRGGRTETASERKQRLRNQELETLFFIDSFFTAAGLRTFRALWGFSLRFICRHPVQALPFIKQTARIPAYSHQVARYIETEKPDAVYSAWGAANIAALLARRAAQRKPRLIVSQHNGVRLRSKKSECKLRSHFIAEADALHVVSRGVEEQMVEEYGVSREKTALVYNPAFHAEILDLKQQKCDHPWVAQKGEEKVLLWAGRAAPQKDLPTLLRAFRILSKRRDVRLILLGAPKKKSWMRGRLQELKELYESVQDRVLLPGYAKNPYSWMAGADAFVLSSQWEGLPTVLIEAMACGCPVVSTDCEHGPREILEDGRWGRLTPVGDAEALADAIDATLDNPPAAEALLARARDFSLERLMPQFMDLLGLPHNTRTG